MKRACYSLLILFGCAASTQAGATEFNSLAYVSQVDAATAGAYSRMDTAAIVKPLMQIASELPKVNAGSSNLALVWQDGDFNQSSIVQSGAGNVGLIRQIGYNNIGDIQQSGSGHQALIFQQGRNNTAIIRQR